MKELNVILSDFLRQHFYNIPLESPLFYNSSVGLRFELGMPNRGVEHASYFTNILLRSIMIFREIFDTDEQMLITIKRFRCIEPYKCSNQGEEVFPKYMKDKELIKQVSSIELKKHYEENGDLSGITYQHILLCNIKSIDYIGILKAKAHQDFAIEPYISDEVFFINLHKHIIFYMYDDRGMDLISESKGALLPIYEKYNSWILAYDKERIDNIFMS
ncbi:hypothetical protein CSC2_05120 [Clostridium zeae]|uniref:DUF3885 domain-containing protein n=1 Tax=Clostridium zeae TaxID=2759022 RepID=A0ABQ1E5G6_9CLOT|nr:DUF3885 domain-containing protein [Clostridium zeae]GFZ29986.1 hypothetical protein CSC2_05120 [Clostridium zeae]